MNRLAKRKQREANPQNVREFEKQSFKKRKAENVDHVRELNRLTKRKQIEANHENVRDIEKQSFRKRKARNPIPITKVNRDAKVRKTQVTNESLTLPSAETQFQNGQNSAPLTTETDKLQVQKTEGNFTAMINLFHNNIGCGPAYICTCCDQLWCRSLVVKGDAKKYKACSQDVLQSCITALQSVDNTEWICTTCNSSLNKGKLPGCSKANNMSFPEKPESLNLTPLEERRISPRIPFMQILELPRGGQLSIHGNIVNVPSDINSTIQCFPRPINESQTIPIKLRPKKVLDAAKRLVDPSALFKS